MGTILTRCEEHGVRMTNQRRVIASVLEQSDDHPDVEELYARVSREDSSISIATVYRVARTCSTSDVPIPNAKAPNAPCVAV